MIGTYADAAFALEGALDYLDQGTSRNVFISDGVVYKVNNTSDDFDDNEYEWRNYSRLVGVEVDERIGIPRCSIFNVNGKNVIAMEYIEGQAMSECWCGMHDEAHTTTCLPPSILHIVKQYIGDTGGANVIFDGKLYWPIDFA